MTLPTLTKTWQFNVNQTLISTGTELTDHQRLLLTIKNTLIGFAQSPWSVYYSCDSVSAGAAGDGNDKWLANGNLVWTNGVAARSWIVLRQAATGFQLLIHCRNTVTATARGIGAYFSIAAGFTGGTTTARPTATDELTVCAENETNTGTGGEWDGSGAVFSCVLHVLHSTDGQCTRAFICKNNQCVAMWMIEVPESPVSGWTTPNVISIKGILNNNHATYARLAKTSGATLLAQAMINTVACNIGFTGEFSNFPGSAVMMAETQAWANDIDGNWPIMPVGFGSDTAGKTGRHGIFFDLFWGSSLSNLGDTYPNDNTYKFTSMGNLIIPWNSTVPIVGV